LPVSAESVVKVNTISAKYSAGPKRIAHCARTGAKSIRPTTDSVPPMNEAIAEIASAGAAAALLRHRVAVERGRHRGRGARDVEQDGADRVAVLRAVVDAREQDQHRGGVEVQRERDRDQDGDAVDRADARQHADDRADEHADERDEQVDRLQGGLEPPMSDAKTSIREPPLEDLAERE
jgi:hypothetical protein